MSIVAFAVIGSLVPQDAAPTTDWATLLRADAQAIHESLEDSHPGPFDTLNPGFQRQLDEGLTRALDRADTTRDVGGYWWAIREYVASFNDGHTALNPTDRLGALPAEWPGFSTSYRGGRHVVTVRADPASPPQGAALIGCDGIDAATLAAENIGRFRGNWSLNTTRIAYGDQLLRQASNPYLIRPRGCDFETDGRVTTHDLRWRPFDEVARDGVKDQLDRLQTRIADPIGLREFAPNQFWITASSFDSDPAGEAGRANTALIQELERRAADLRKADRIVLDLRGNNGGSSHWGAEMAKALWGEAYVKAHAPGSGYVEWRASDGNIANVARIREQYRGQEGTVFAWADRIVTGLESARAAGQPLWRQTSAAAPPETPIPAGEDLVSARVYLLTDYYCGSACLDASDLWLALGAVQIGEETFADSQYMEVRFVDLPSGYARLVVPTKVYRDRPRGPGETLVPRYPRTGPLTDTAALETWVQTLP